MKVPKFLVEFVTPIVRVSIGVVLVLLVDSIAVQVTKGREKINFFTIPEYEQWLEQTANSHLWTAKYYKVRQPD